MTDIDIEESKSFTLMHDSFSWIENNEISFIAGSKEIILMKPAFINDKFVVGKAYNKSGELLNDSMPWAVGHVPSGTIFGLWSDKMMAQYHADTMKPLYSGWDKANIEDMNTSTSALIKTLPNVITASVLNHILPHDPRYPNLNPSYIQ